MPHLPILWFGAHQKNILVPYSKKTGLVTLSLDYNSMWYSLHRGKKNRSAAVNPHRTSSSRGDLQSVRGLCNAYIITKGLKITRAFWQRGSPLSTKRSFRIQHADDFLIICSTRWVFDLWCSWFMVPKWLSPLWAWENCTQSLRGLRWPPLRVSDVKLKRSRSQTTVRLD